MGRHFSRFKWSYILLIIEISTFGYAADPQLDMMHRVETDGLPACEMLDQISAKLDAPGMIEFTSTPIPGAYLIRLAPHRDRRGYFMRTMCEREFAQYGLESRFVQVNESFSTRRGTLRGMHYQLPPAAEVKVVRCVQGEIYDVILDLRRDQPTFGRWFGTVLSAQEQTQIYVPKGVAHGFISLVDNTRIFYLTSAFHTPEAERGVRYDDPLFDIKWPIMPQEISDRDMALPDFSTATETPL